MGIAAETARRAGADLVILGADLGGPAGVGIRVRQGMISEVGPGIRPEPGEPVVDAGGGAVVAGLRDHHLHLRALSAAGRSVLVGPPSVRDAQGLVDALRQAASAAGPRTWLRGVGYHDSVAGPLDRHRLDAIVADHPMRIQHRSGQLWILNRAGLDRLGLEQGDGRLLHADGWLRDRLRRDGEGGTDPVADLAAVGRRLASYGVTGVSDATVSNGPDDAALLEDSIDQQVLVMGDDRLGHGPRKVLLHDDDLPGLDDLSQVIRSAHGQGRVAAVHCVTAPSLWFALSAFAEAGCVDGDRIEHGSVVPPEAAAGLVRLGLTVVTQPNFIHERGDAYLAEVDPDDRPWLYRVAGLLAIGIPLAAGTDAPFGDPDPWRAMTAAVERRTENGRLLGGSERVSPEQALALFTGDLEHPGRPEPLRAGAAGDLCVLSVPWREARRRLSSDLVRATVRGGHVIHGAGEASG